MHRSCHCLIIQTWCIYSFSTKESRPPCIMNHQVWGTVSRLDDKFLYRFPIWVSWLICGKKCSQKHKHLINMFKFCRINSSTVSEQVTKTRSYPNSAELKWGAKVKEDTRADQKLRGTLHPFSTGLPQSREGSRSKQQKPRCPRFYSVTWVKLQKHISHNATRYDLSLDPYWQAHAFSNTTAPVHL